MRYIVAVAVAAAVLFGVAAPAAHAQKGVGDLGGVARKSVRPEIVFLSGEIIEIRTGPCESTTGRSLTGTHLILETAQEEQLNVHLGPADAVADTVAKLSVGQMIVVKAFRTEKMKEKHYVAQSLTFDKTTVELRDAGLRPVWAGRAFGPQWPAARGAGFGRGRGQGRGRGWGRGQGRGPGWGRGGQRWLAAPQRGPATPQQRPATPEQRPATPEQRPATPEQRPGTARKVAVTAAGPSMDAAIDPRFGRCRYFLLVDTERGTFEVLENTPTTGGNAGVQAAEMIAGKGAQVLLTGECGPNASKALAAAGIQVIPGCSGTVGALVKQFKAGKLAPASKTQTTPESASGKVPGPGKRRP